MLNLEHARGVNLQVKAFPDLAVTFVHLPCVQTLINYERKSLPPPWKVISLGRFNTHHPDVHTNRSGHWLLKISEGLLINSPSVTGGAVQSICDAAFVRLGVRQGRKTISISLQRYLCYKTKKTSFHQSNSLGAFCSVAVISRHFKSNEKRSMEH